MSVTLNMSHSETSSLNHTRVRIIQNKYYFSVLFKFPGEQFNPGGVFTSTLRKYDEALNCRGTLLLFFVCLCLLFVCLLFCSFFVCPVVSAFSFVLLFTLVFTHFLICLLACLIVCLLACLLAYMLTCSFTCLLTCLFLCLFDCVLVCFFDCLLTLFDRLVGCLCGYLFACLLRPLSPFTLLHSCRV